MLHAGYAGAWVSQALYADARPITARLLPRGVDKSPVHHGLHPRPRSNRPQGTREGRDSQIAPVTSDDRKKLQTRPPRPPSSSYDAESTSMRNLPSHPLPTPYRTCIHLSHQQPSPFKSSFCAFVAQRDGINMHAEHGADRGHGLSRLVPWKTSALGFGVPPRQSGGNI